MLLYKGEMILTITFALASTACHCKPTYSCSAWEKLTTENAEGSVASELIENDTDIPFHS